MMRVSATRTTAVFVIAIISLSLASCGKQTDYRGQANNTTEVKPADRPLQLTQFEVIHGTHYLMAEITEARSGGFSSSLSRESGNT
jgi:hypothetical protein